MYISTVMGRSKYNRDVYSFFKFLQNTYRVAVRWTWYRLDRKVGSIRLSFWTREKKCITMTKGLSISHRNLTG